MAGSGRFSYTAIALRSTHQSATLRISHASQFPRRDRCAVSSPRYIYKEKLTSFACSIEEINYTKAIFHEKKSKTYIRTFRTINFPDCPKRVPREYVEHIQSAVPVTLRSLFVRSLWNTEIIEPRIGP